MSMLRSTCVLSKRNRLFAMLILCLVAVAPAAFADGHTLSGTVYGGNAVLPNTLVEALNAGTTHVAASVTTDSGGKYSLVLTDAQYNLHVVPPSGSGFVEATTPITMNGADQTSDVILLAPASGGGALSGVVRTANGTVLPNVTVYAYAQQTNEYLGQTQTDASGHYAMTVTASTIRVYITNNWSNAPNAPYYWDFQRYNIAVSNPTIVDVNLPLVQVSGIVKGKDGVLLGGAPVSGASSSYDPATSTYFDSQSYATAAADGSYSLLLTSGNGGLSASPPNNNYWPMSESVAFTGNLSHDLLLDVRENGTISGTIRGAGNAPLPNITVYAYVQATNQYLGQTQTDANGVYQLSAATGTIRLYYTNNWNNVPNAPYYWDYQRYNVNLTGSMTLDVTLPLVRVTGVVKGEDGTTLPGAPVSASSSAYDSATSSYFDSQSYGTSAADASYSLLVTAGSGGLSASPPNTDYWPMNESFVFSADVTHDLVLAARHNSTISGTIRGAGSNPLPNTTIYAYVQSTNQYLGQTSTDANGYYQLAAANGTIRLYITNNWSNAANAPYYWDFQRYNVQLNGPMTLDVDLPLAHVRGIATDSNGVGVPNVSVNGSTSSYDAATSTYFDSQSYATTAADGTYSMWLTNGSGGFGISPPQQSGFKSASLPLSLSNDINQRIILQHPDLAPPQIVAGPVVVHLSATSVSISWTTNEASTSQVQYGIGGLSSTSSDSSMTTKHEVTLRDLALASLYQFRVGSTDAVGNGPTFSAVDTFATQAIADSTAPRITDGPTVTAVDQTSAIIQWTTDEPATTSLNYGLGQSLGTVVNGSANRFTLAHSVRLTDLTAQTTYFVQVSSSDPDANTATSSLFSLTTLSVPDTSAPAILDGPTITSITDTKMTVSWTTDEPANSGVSYNDGTHFDLASDSTLTRTHQLTLSGLTPSTTYYIRVASTDANGNGPTLSGTISATTAATPDTTAPVISGVSVTGVTPSSAVISWTTDEPSNSRARYGTTAGAADNSTADVTSVVQHQITLTGLAESSTYFFTVSSTDASNNTSTSAEASFTTGTNHVDQAPTAPGPITAPRVTNAQSFTITWGASTDDVAVAQYEVIRNGAVIATLPASATTYGDSGTGEGSYTYTIRATDSAGHTASSDPSTVIVDRTAPQITAADVSAEATGAATTINYTAGGTDNVDGAVAVTCSPASGTQFGVGSTTVTCSASDAAGNSGSTSFSVVVKDTTKPCLNVPSSISKEATASNGAAATFTATAKDLVDGAIAATCTPASGATFAVGTTSVTCTATDAAGNKATRSFDVKVVDTIAPAVTVPSNLTLEAISSRGAAATFAASGSDIVSGVVPASCSPASGATFAIGDTVVTCTATDAAGNRGTGRFSVIVRDTTAPVVTVPKDMTLEASNKDGAIGAYVATASDIVNGNIAPVCSPASGSTFAIGTTTVTCTARDVAGNAASASFKITVKDATAPAIASVTPSQSTLWPPDHRLVSMTVAVSASDRVDPSPVCTIASIKSSEVINGLGDGDTWPDWDIGNGLSFQLRAERAGKGPGRIYTITVDCADKSGNHATKSATVSVPKNQPK